MSQDLNTKENFQAQRPHVLVVDDDRRIRDLLSRYLGEQGFVVMSAGDAKEAVELLEHFAFDVLVVDVMMPGQSGLDFVRAHSQAKDTPVLLLTALGETAHRIDGLEAGADDYLAKPFEPRELLLRLNAILKRTIKPQKSLAYFKIGPWVFDADSETLEGEGRVQKLTSVEVALIKALAVQGGEVVSRAELAQLCGIDAGERTFDVQVTRLRRKIEMDTKNPRYLQTIRGKGYLLRIEEVL
jgi:two-component system phosphate regulon response regulator OmpR